MLHRNLSREINFPLQLPKPSRPKYSTPDLKTTRTKQSLVVMLIVTFFLNLFAFRLIQMQVFEGQYNRTRAEQNRIRKMPVIADRGNIVDRNGKLLAANRLTRAVYIWPKEQTPNQWQQTTLKLSQLLEIPQTEILKKLEKTGYKSTMPVRITRDINPKAFTVLAEKMSEFTGVEIREESSRYYPNGSIGAHILGYIGEATEEDLKENPNYPMGMIVGQMGIERKVNQKLAGVWGNRLVEVDAVGTEVREIGVVRPKSGEGVRLTLDLELQKTAEKALNGRRGGIAVIDIKTGAVLALASGPSFDPNLFTGKVSTSEWQKLQAQDKPFLNRALQGYPPGSTFKIVTSVAGMESGKYTPDSIVVSSESIVVGGVSFHEHGSGYGPIGFADALAYSSNTFYYQVGINTGPEKLSEWAHKMGIGETTNLDLLGLGQGTHGSVPTPAEKKKLYGEDWYAGDTVTMAIGQGVVLVTPLEMAVMIASIANGGYRVKPHLLADQTNQPATKPEATGMKPQTYEKVRQGLVAVVQKGTGQGLNDGSIPLTAGKTGTAEVFGQQDNSNYVAYGPAGDPQIAIGIVVENGGYGATAAAPIAQEIFKTYFHKRH